MSSYSSSIAERLAARILVVEGGCWEWQGSRNTFGYGRISRGSRGSGVEAAHRVAWKLAHGPIPDGQYVLHRCDNPPCCNPEHLFLGSLKDNSDDMMSKGRGRAQIPAGERHPDARLSDEQIAQMRQVAPTLGNYAELGRRYGVSKQHARNVALGLKRAA
jgi:hypothetical protein